MPSSGQSLIAGNKLRLSPSLEYQGDAYQDSLYMPLPVGDLPRLERSRRSLGLMSKVELNPDALQNPQIQENLGYTQGLHPSSLDVLLTPDEIESRRSSFFGGSVNNTNQHGFDRYEEAFMGNWHGPLEIGVAPLVPRRISSNSDHEIFPNLLKSNMTERSSGFCFAEDVAGISRTLPFPITMVNVDFPHNPYQHDANIPKVNSRQPSFDEEIQFYMEEEASFMDRYSSHNPQQHQANNHNPLVEDLNNRNDSPLYKHLNSFHKRGLLDDTCPYNLEASATLQGADRQHNQEDSDIRLDEMLDSKLAALLKQCDLTRN
ncbi:hypothetical protein K493DRAFT_404116 [Basidiobolus meristosporus CBS 931.73]|uniref:Uncharacterized protein n=1 Tax=Basidiobolus meristosporus CBS 931.73 TaxID=1314790 RepID=A0A1Y1Z778_9FUNG|nr:hypothetical protein K493DRAFT_404116 [Basidiobolus meristosporus CBS 931.73]|eukprot:ORY06066.1 hypothetical protein K493DRAFT_404116 [Basidiobolus meristosporus CBS 931.73]